MDRHQISIFQSRETDDWLTPPDLYQKLDREFRFEFDPCPLNPDFDGLSVDWKRRTFVNPPYSQVGEWLKKARVELDKGNCDIIVFLVFANTDTEWFHNYVYGKAEIRFLKGRVSFLDRYGNKRGGAMRPSMVVIFRRDDGVLQKTIESFGVDGV